MREEFGFNLSANENALECGVKDDLDQHLRIKCILANGCIISVVKIGEIQFIDSSTDDPCTKIRRDKFFKRGERKGLLPMVWFEAIFLNHNNTAEFSDRGLLTICLSFIQYSTFVMFCPGLCVLV